MKFKFKNFAFIIALLFSVAFIACNKDNDEDKNEPCETHVDENNDKVCDKCNKPYDPDPVPPVVDPVIEIKANTDKITIKDEELEGYNFKSLFKITKDDNNVEVLDDHLDLSALKDDAGTYTITCNYEGKTASLLVEVVATKYNVVSYVEEITINVSLVETYNYLSLFVATKDGKAMSITEDMIENNVVAEAGTYTYTVTVQGASATLTVHVTNDHDIKVIESYNDVEIYFDELDTFDYTSLFSLYVNGTVTEVTYDMIDLSDLEEAKVGNSYRVTLKYELGISKISYDVNIKVLASRELKITSKNLVIYPNSEYINLCTLFEIKIGDEIIPVTNDMITGVINYTNVGVNEITLKYQDEVAVATVEVKKGVVIDYRYSDVVTIIKGENQKHYDFSNDFKVVVDGVEMTILPEKYLDTTNVDFNTPGTYEVKLTIPYNDKTFGLSGVKFTYFEKIIKYVVINNDYKIEIKDDLVEFSKGTTEYNVYKNLKVTINGKNQTLTENPEYASIIACYVETLSDQIDFNKPGKQEVKIAVYVNGPDNDPVIITYYVIMETDLLVEATNKIIFTGETLYTKDLFKITQGGNDIEVLNDYINGNVNAFKPGVYNVNINYFGIEEVAKVVVLDREMIGSYKTLLTTIDTVETNDSDEEIVIKGKLLADLVINEDGTINALGRKTEITNAVDENTFTLKIGSYDYTMHYQDGIIILDPDNSIRLTYNDDKRPAIFFKTNKYQVLERFIINSNDDYVLLNNFVSYSIDVFRIQDTTTYEQKWYAFNVALSSKMGSDTVYSISWGEAQFAEGFVNDINKESILTFDGNEYEFKVLTKGNAKIKNIDNSKVFANMTFNGLYYGKQASLIIDQYGGCVFKTNDEVLCSIGSYDISQMRNGGPNSTEKTLLIYSFKEEVFAYKFKLYLEAKTFEYIEKDTIFGKYQYDNYMMFFDGYGTGILQDDVTSYYQYQFTYSVNGKEISIDYFNTDHTFLYGDNALLYMDDLGNTLTVGFFENQTIIGEKFENQNVIDGAIIRVNIQKIGANSDTNAKAELYNNIEIVTKDGIITGDSLKSYINTSYIRFNTAGFYEFTIKVTVNGQEITNYYGLQVLESLYSDNSLIGTYSGVTSNVGIVIDKYGYAIIKYSDAIYEGFTKIYDDNTFVINAYNENHASITVTGETLTNKLLKVRCTGSVSFVDYLTTGEMNIIGCEGYVLRSIKINDETTYILGTSETSLGSIVHVELLSGTSVLSSGSILKVYDDENEVVVKVISWGNSKGGLILSDAYRGEYVLDLESTITLDGFGKATIAGDTGTYDLNGANATIVIKEDTYVYKLNNVDYTCEKIEITLDNTLLQGRALGSSYNYYCFSYQYVANTSFEFRANGEVIVRSSSSTHDEGEDSCMEDLYSPLFASKDGVKGTYNVKGNKVTIVVNGYVMVFKISNVLNVKDIVCISTTVDSESHGYFKTGTVFE